MTASGVLFPIGSQEDEGRLGRFLVVARGSTVVSAVAQSRSLESCLTEIAKNLEEAEEHVAATAATTDVAATQGQELHEMWLLVAALTVVLGTPPHPSPGSAPASLRSWPASTAPASVPAHNQRHHSG
jgi:hypothetical protein